MGKISSHLAAQLNGLKPQQKVRAIVLLGKKEGVSAHAAKRQSPNERKMAIQSMRKELEQAIADIDHILSCFAGRRLAESPDALGSIPVETTSEGIKALSESEWIKAIIEDQALHSIR